MMTDNDPLCACGEPLHYSDDTVRRVVELIAHDLGEYVPVRLGERVFRVQRHYIALHGLKASELAGLGFEEIV